MRFSIVVSLVLIACGGDDSNKRLPDAPPLSDGPVDTPDPAVTLTVTRDGAPVPGVHVYFLNADDSVVKTVDTDAAGTASALMTAGGSVTAIDPFPAPVVVGVAARVIVGDNDLRTFLGVKPGDHLALTRTTPQPVSITLFGPIEPNADVYDVFTTCGTGSLSPGGGGSGSGSPNPGGTFGLTGCGGTADIAIVTREFEGEGNTLTARSGLFHANTALTDGTVDLTEETYTDLTDVMFTYAHAPDASITVLHAPVLARGPLGPFAVDASGGSGTSREPSITALASIVDTAVFQRSRHDVIERGPSTTNYNLDLDTVLLPDIVDGPSYNPTTRKVSWTEAAQGVAPDLTTAMIDVSQSERSWRWQIAAPYTPGELRFPRLPTDVANWAPTVDAFISQVRVMNAQVPNHYDAVRARILDVWDLDVRHIDNDRQPDVTAFVAGANARVSAVHALVDRRSDARASRAR